MFSLSYIGNQFKHPDTNSYIINLCQGVYAYKKYEQIVYKQVSCLRWWVVHWPIEVSSW